jgi:predicted enzyme related to lactoylglutathione lyase
MDKHPQEGDLTMSERQELLPGSFCWPELATPDSPKAKEFYAGLFGWSPVDMPTSGGTYTLLQLRDKDVAALRTLSAQETEGGTPPHWLSYISTASADASAARAAELGGTVLAGPFDVEQIGRMAMIRDPEGAVFALWEARGHIGARIVGEASTLCWTELVTGDVDGAKAFYGGLFGWTTKSSSTGSAPDYVEIYREEQPIGGFLPRKEGWDQIPAHWMPYFFVVDCDAAVARAIELGGSVPVPAMDIPEVGRFAVLSDPSGAHFSVIAMVPMPAAEKP